MSDRINIQTTSNLNYLKININDPISNEQYMVFDISYGKTDPLFIYLETSDIIKYNDQEIIFDLNSNLKLKDFFDKIDEVMINYIQTNKILKKYGLKNFNYNPINAIYTNKDTTKSDICKLRIDLNSQTQIFTNKDTQVKPSEWMKLGKAKLKGKCIAEFVELVIDKVGQTIFLNIMIRQLKIKKVRTTRVTNLPYSFVDSEEENLESTAYSIQFKNKNKHNYNDQDSVTMSAIAPTTQKDEINASESQGYAEYSAINTFPHKKNRPVKISEKSSEDKEDTNNTEVIDDNTNTEYNTNKKERTNSSTENTKDNTNDNTKDNTDDNTDENSKNDTESDNNTHSSNSNNSRSNKSRSNHSRSNHSRSNNSSTKRKSNSEKSNSEKSDFKQNITTEVSEDF